MANDRSSGVRDSDVQDSQDRDSDKDNSAATLGVDVMPESSSPSTEGGRREESSFSFKHFLRNSAESATNSNLNGPSGGTKSALRTNFHGSPNKTATTGTAGGSSGSQGQQQQQQQQNLGARPKQYSLHNGLDQQLPRMKRSPKFPSFDSHASLSEYSEEVSSSFVQRSHSNYEVETPSAASFSRRSPVNHGGLASREPSLSSGNCNSPSGSGNRNTSEFQAALPDFVKDHMVLEQWYQTNPFRTSSTGGGGVETNETTGEDLEPLSRRNYHNSNLFDLAMGSVGASSGSSSGFRLATNSPTVPLDLPIYEGNSVANERLHHRFNPDRHSNPSNNNLAAVGDLPLDLTERHRVNSRNDLVGSIGGPQREESPTPQMQADMIQTLPDFLSDGPIHSSGRLADVAQDLPQLDSPEENAAVNVISRLRLENDRLRHELDEARRVISDQGRQINDLERSCRNGEIQRNGTMLERNKLNQKIAQLTEEVGQLKQENESLREEDGAVGGGKSREASSRDKDAQRRVRCQNLSRELYLAAETADANLRQLLAGVGNLRMLANRVENVNEERDPIEDYISDCEDEDFLDEPGAGL